MENLRSLNSKLENLREFIREKGRNGLVVSFSGGVDSATLTAICIDLIDEVIAVTVKSEVMPESEFRDAKRIAKEIGVKHYVVNVEILSNEEFVRNSRNRCYVCKKIMIKNIKSLAKSFGIDVILDGTNASDLRYERPGYKAILEEGIYCPFVYAKITKEEVRAIARDLGLSFYDKPENSCLATRIPFDERITIERLKRIEKAEKVVKSLTGIGFVRVRDHGYLARIEVRREDLNRFLRCNIDRVVRSLKDLGYEFVTLEGYKKY